MKKILIVLTVCVFLFSCSSDLKDGEDILNDMAGDSSSSDISSSSLLEVSSSSDIFSSSSSAALLLSSSSLPEGTVICLLNGVCALLNMETCLAISGAVVSEKDCSNSSSSSNINYISSSSNVSTPSSVSAQSSNSIPSSASAPSSSSTPSSSSDQNSSSSVTSSASTLSCEYQPSWCGNATSITQGYPDSYEYGRNPTGCFFVADISAICTNNGNDVSINGVFNNGNHWQFGCWGSNTPLPAKADGGYYIYVPNEWDINILTSIAGIPNCLN
jgi:hypothetical protein